MTNKPQYPSTDELVNCINKSKQNKNRSTNSVSFLSAHWFGTCQDLPCKVRDKLLHLECPQLRRMCNALGILKQHATYLSMLLRLWLWF